MQFSDMNKTISDGMGRGGMNVLRLVSMRMKRVVESCATMLTNTREADGPDSLPLDLMNRCRRIELIRCCSHNLRSLEGCPNRLKSLHIDNGQHIQSLEPLRGCSGLERLRIDSAFQVSDLSPLAECTIMTHLYFIGSCVTDISVLASMPRLLSVAFPKLPGQPSIKDLSPLASCKSITGLYLEGNSELKDLSLLKILTGLKALSISSIPTDDLTPLTALPKLQILRCNSIPTATSLLPLERCTGLRKVLCDSDAKDLAILQQKRPNIEFDITEVPL